MQGQGLAQSVKNPREERIKLSGKVRNRVVLVSPPPIEAIGVDSHLDTTRDLP